MGIGPARLASVISFLPSSAYRGSRRGTCPCECIGPLRADRHPAVFPKPQANLLRTHFPGPFDEPAPPMGSPGAPWPACALRSDPIITGRRPNTPPAGIHCGVVSRLSQNIGDESNILASFPLANRWSRVTAWQRFIRNPYMDWRKSKIPLREFPTSGKLRRVEFTAATFGNPPKIPAVWFLKFPKGQPAGVGPLSKVKLV